MGVLFGSRSGPVAGGSILGDVQKHLSLWTPPPPPTRSYDQLSPSEKDSLFHSVNSNLGTSGVKKPTPQDLSQLTDQVSPNYKNPARIITDPVLEPIRNAGSAVRQLSGQNDAELNAIDEKLRKKQISNDEAMRQRQVILDRNAWAGTKTDTGLNLRKAAGVGIGVATNFIPGGKVADKPLIAKVAGDVGKGVLFGTAGATGADLAHTGNINPEDVAGGAIAGGAFGGALSLVSPAVKGIANLNRGEAKPLDIIPSVHANDEGVIKTQSMGEGPSKIEQAGQIPSKINQSLFDRYAPVKDFVKQITGKDIEAHQDPYQLLKLRAGAEGQVYQYLQDNASWLKDIPRQIRKDGDAYGYAKQYLSQAEKRTPEQLQKAQNTLDRLNQKYGGDVSTLEAYTDKVRRSFDPLLDHMVEAGMLPKDKANALKGSPDYFAKMEVLHDDTSQKLATGSVNTRQNDALMGIKGQSNDSVLAPSSEALVQQTTRAFNNMANNKVVRAVADLAERPESKGLILKPEGNTFPEGKLSKDYTRLSYIDQGVRKEIAVPKDVGEVFRGANIENFDKVTSMMGKINNLFRQGVTTYNPLFTFFRNPIRDFKTFMMNSRYVPVQKAVFSYASGMMDSLFNGKWSKEFRRAGAGQAGYFARESGQTGGKQVANIAKQITGKRTIVGRIVKSPLDLYEHVSQAIEQAPRVAEFKNAVLKGASKERAAVAGREVTVDFAQGGDFSKVLNQWIPFLNARAQGTRRTMQAFKENPARALTVWAATSAVPVATLMWWNKTHNQDVWDQIPNYEKENNFLIISGNAKDAQGRFTQVIKIPKGDVDKILGNTLETMLDQFSSKNPKDLAQLVGSSALSAASNISPVGFESNGKFSPSQVLSQGLPPIVKAPTQAVANYDFFKEAPIVPDSMKGAPANEQVQGGTSQIAKALGVQFGISPLKVDSVLSTLGGNVPTDVTQNPLDKGGFVERMSQGPSGVAGNKVRTDFYNIYGPAADFRDYTQSKIYKLLDQGKAGEAQRKADEYNRQIDQKFAPFFKENGHYATPEAIGSPGQPANPIDMISRLKLDVVISKRGKAYIKK